MIRLLPLSDVNDGGIIVNSYRLARYGLAVDHIDATYYPWFDRSSAPFPPHRAQHANQHCNFSTTGY